MLIATLAPIHNQPDHVEEEYQSLHLALLEECPPSISMFMIVYNNLHLFFVIVAFLDVRQYLGFLVKNILVQKRLSCFHYNIIIFQQ